MTYKLFKAITTGLLTGDNVLPQSPDVMTGLMQYALTTVATQADSLHLMTLSTTVDVLRLAQGDYLIRMPVPPVVDTDLLDIDDELAFAVARYLASYVSKEKGGIHVQAADRIIKDYNAKTYEITEQMQTEALAANVIDLSYSAPSSEWNL
jgi:hypothetical protein